MGKITRNPHIIWDQVDGVPTFCHTETSEFYRMNEVGRLIWEMCDRATVEDIVRRLSAIYPNEETEQLASEARCFILRLQDFGLTQEEIA